MGLPANADRITAIQSPQPVQSDPATGTLLLLRGQTWGVPLGCYDGYAYCGQGITHSYAIGSSGVTAGSAIASFGPTYVSCNGLEVAFFATRWVQGAVRDDGTPVTLQAVAWNVEDCSVPPQTDDG